MAILESRISAQSQSFIANKAVMSEVVGLLKKRVAEAAKGGGEDAASKHRSRGKLLARERIQAVIDPGTEF